MFAALSVPSSTVILRYIYFEKGFVLKKNLKLVPIKSLHTHGVIITLLHFHESMLFQEKNYFKF